MMVSEDQTRRTLLKQQRRTKGALKRFRNERTGLQMSWHTAGDAVVLRWREEDACKERLKFQELSPSKTR
jgi:hypothetical protein